MPSIDYVELITRFCMNLVSMLILVFGMYYRRYKHKETAISAALFNTFIFAVLSVLSLLEFSLAAGFGLFAILALFTLRSEPISKSDIAYFFGSISIAVVCAIQGTSLLFVVIMVLCMLVAVYVIDHPEILKSVNQTTVRLDSIPERCMSDPGTLKQELSRRLGVEVLSYRILSVCYVTEVIQVEVDYRFQ
ncbi:MAG: DUF4956 domain-containing protein [Hydrogenophaga sp.]|jgi:hypothetical protein|nr:DUF4956 domain-containing protein [Hydrogenophaga sp.]